MLSLPAKLVIGVFGGGLVFSFGATIAYSVIQTNKAKENHLFLISETLSDNTANGNIVLEGKGKNFKCKYDQIEDPLCSVEEYSSTDAKKLVTFDDDSTKYVGATATNLKAADKLFRIKVSKKLFEGIKFDGTNKLELISTSDSSKKYGSLKPLFVKNKENQHWTNKLFLAKAINIFPEGDKTTVTLPTDTTNHKCSIDGSLEETKLKDCKVYTFATSQPNASAKSSYKDLTFVGNKNTSSTTINKHYFYLIELTEALKKEQIRDLNLLYVVDKQGTTNPKTWTKLVEFNNINEAVWLNSTNPTRLGIIP